MNFNIHLAIRIRSNHQTYFWTGCFVQSFTFFQAHKVKYYVVIQCSALASASPLNGNHFATSFKGTELGPWKVRKCQYLNQIQILGPLKRGGFRAPLSIPFTLYF